MHLGPMLSARQSVFGNQRLWLCFATMAQHSEAWALPRFKLCLCLFSRRLFLEVQVFMGIVGAPVARSQGSMQGM